MSRLLLVSIFVLLACCSRAAIQWQYCDPDDPLCTREDYGVDYEGVIRFVKLLDASLKEGWQDFELEDLFESSFSDQELSKSFICRECESIFGKLQSADINKLARVVEKSAVFLCKLLKIE